jgi:hypothetical protein
MKLSSDDELRIKVMLQVFGVEVTPESRAEIDQYIIENKPSDEDLYEFILSVLDKQFKE